METAAIRERLASGYFTKLQKAPEASWDPCSSGSLVFEFLFQIPKATWPVVSQEFLLRKRRESWGGFWVNNRLITRRNSVQTHLLWESSNSFCVRNLASTAAGTFSWYTWHCGKKKKENLFWEVTSKTKTLWFSIPRHNKEAIYIISASESQSNNAFAGLIKNYFRKPSRKTLLLPEYRMENISNF